MAEEETKSAELSGQELIAGIISKAKDLRHHLHENPELGLKEYDTQKAIKEALTSSGVPESEIIPCAGTGLVVNITGSGPAASDASPRVLAIRADIDALPMPEANPDLPYRSKRDGVAHACGHDGHVASAVAAALLVHARREKLASNCVVRFLFQPAEEGPGGAEPMIAEGCMEGVTDGVWGFHNINILPLGHIWVQPGVATAHCCDFDITVKGKGGHGSSQHAACDPILAAAQIIVSLNHVVPRCVAPSSKAVLSVCCVKGGTTTNVIPDTAVIKGTMRDFDPRIGKLLQEKLVQVATSTALSYGTEAVIELDDSYPSIVNEAEATKEMTALSVSLFGEERVVGDVGGMPGAEDFSYFLHHSPGCFVQIGGLEESTECPMPHMSSYNYNDKITPIAAGLWVKLAELKFGAELYTEEEAVFPSELPAASPAGIEAFKGRWN